METAFTPLLSLFGGVLIGLAATLYMAFHSRIAGMTGILSGVIPPFASDWKIKAAFLAGAILAPMAFVASGGTVEFAVPVSTTSMVLGGFIAGIGVWFGSGCTSGHGVCGMARFSPRSFAATLAFMVATFATVFVTRHLIGA
jgi:uncharacterized protein